MAVFVFGAARRSAFDSAFLPAPPAPAPTDAEAFFPEGVVEAGLAPAFTAHFDVRFAGGAWPFSGAARPEHMLWVRHKDHGLGRDGGVASAVALMALADMPPPAATSMFTTFAPFSSVTWMLNFLVDPASAMKSRNDENEWLLMETRGEHARAGYSSQDMFIWNSDGEALVAGRQCVAIFT